MRSDRLLFTRTVTWQRHVSEQRVYAFTAACVGNRGTLHIRPQPARGMKGGGAWGGLHVTWSVI